MTTSMRRRLWVSLFLLTVNSQSFAQDSANESVMRLDDMVVTGTRTPKSLKEGPVKTEVVGEAEIKERRLRNAAEAILEIPGVTLSNATGKTGQSAVLQGLGGEHVLVLIDGAPVLQNSSAGVDLTQISANDIQRIEVVKGGASALYGGQAMGGVINIITKRPKEGFSYELDLMKEFFPADKSAAGARRQVNPSAPNQIKGLASARQGANAWKLSLSRQAEASIDRDLLTVTRDTPDLEKNQVGLFYERDLGERRKVNFEAGYADESATTYAARLQPDTLYRAVENRGDINRLRARAGYQVSPSESSTVSVYVLGERVDDRLDMEDDPATPAVESSKSAVLDRQRIETQWDFSPTEEHVVSLGAVVEAQKLDQRNRTAINETTTYDSVEVGGRSQNSIEIFAQDDWIRDRHEIITGARLTHDPAFGLHIDPKINWLHPTNWFDGHTTSLRASIGTGFRRPNLKERYYLLDHRSFAGYVVYGDENLRPEESVSAQVGLEVARGQDYSVNGNLFYNRVGGLITTTEIATGTSERAFRFANLDRVQIQGLELAGAWKFAQAWRLSPSFVYTRARDEGSGLYVPNRPFYLGQLNLLYEFSRERGNMNATLRYSGDSYADIANTEAYPGYSVVDLRYNRPLNRNLEIYLGIRNLLDERRATMIDGTAQVYDLRPATGRTVFVGLNFEG